jgi:molecular chaperone GrpE
MPEDVQRDKKEDEEPMDDLSKCQKERDEYLDGWKRTKADLINYKKDEGRRFEAVVRFANETIIKDLISVLDSFDLAILALESQTRTNADLTRTDAVRGLYLIRTQLEDTLRQQGLERVIVSVGQLFDPNLQEAIASVESDKPSGTVVEEVERGYLLNGKLIRPARVKVAK